MSNGNPTLIFDLDNCLAPATAVGETLYAAAFDAICLANDGSVSEATLEAAFEDCWAHALDWVAERHGFTQAMLSDGWKVFEKMEVEPPIEGYDDLRELERIPGDLYLVTSGFRKLQSSKIRALGIAPHFKETFIDAIDDKDRVRKQPRFERIIQSNSLDPSAVVIVGDNEHSEIRAGNQLGLRTVQTMRPGVTRASSATHHVSGLVELRALVDSLFETG